MKIAIYGYNGYGQALEEVYLQSPFGQPLIKDEDRNDYKRYKKLDYLNICIPYSEDFVKIVIEEILKYEPKLTFIHSIVPPYTTKDIRAKTRLPVVHSPIRYSKDKSLKSLLNFIKYIGVENSAEAGIAREHFVMIGITKNKIFKPAVITELNSLISNAYYAHNIVFADYVQDLLEQFKGKYEQYVHFNDSYNRGYRRLRMKHVNRPTLVPPEDKKIGGDIIKNTKLLHEVFPHEITERILKYE